MEQTPLPVDQPQSAEQAPSAAASSAADQSDDAGDDGSPISTPEEPTAAPTRKTVAPTRTSPAQPLLRYACRQPAAAGHRECDAIVRSDLDAAHVNCNRTVPYCASDLQAASGLSQIARNGGRGASVAVVDAYGYPSAAADLAVYRKRMGLPSCSTGCLRVVNQSGRAAPLPKPNGDAADDWRAEQALDLDMVSAICPNCKIVLVQANSSKSTDLAAAANTAAALGAFAVSNPYGGREESGTDLAYRHPGHVMTASAGDQGPGARGPCSYASVVCVGGTSLVATSSGRGWQERTWPDTGSGCSARVAKPSWQHVKRCATRSEVDVAAVADPATGVAVYESAGGGWQQMGGTSVGAAIVAALFALGPSSARANAPQWIWRHGSTAYRRVEEVRMRYDSATGWGTPQGIAGF
jgi:hypothetical protein